ncbi:MAG TPA: PorV/PorQ family protein [Ignavibacteriaceae bacterium]|nr:PorV/PorQ family protein [Ignavibacteriaceae bacterium]
MKKIFQLTIILLTVCGMTFISQAQPDRSTSKVGTTAAQFLKIGPGARAIGMGGAYTGVSNDIYSVYWNPAGITNIQNSGEVTFNHSAWLADITYNFAAAALNVQDMGTFFVTLTNLGIPEDIVRTFDFPEGDGRVWDASSLAIGIGFARKLTDKFSIGFHAKYLREAIWNSSASGVAIDVGTHYITPFNDMVIAASISNFGTKMQMDGRDILFNYDPDGDPTSGVNNVLSKYEMGKYDLPLTFRLGLAMDAYKDRYFRATTALDAVHPNDNTEYVNLGLELAYDEMFMFRVGYKSLFLRDSEQGLTLGGGLNYRLADQFAVRINYGWADYGRLKNVQFFDVSINF